MGALPHEEYTCHADGQRRQNILNRLKLLLDQFDDRPCVETAVKERPLVVYPGYPDLRSPRNMPPYTTMPFIQSTHTHEIRPTATYRLLNQDLPHVTFQEIQGGASSVHVKSPWERPRYDSTELRASNFYSTCECARKNGLQDKCPRRDCGGRPECYAGLSPGCLPSSAFGIRWPEKKTGDPPYFPMTWPILGGEMRQTGGQNYCQQCGGT